MINLYAKDLFLKKDGDCLTDIGKAVASIARGDWNFSTGMVFEISGGLNIHKL